MNAQTPDTSLTLSARIAAGKPIGVGIVGLGASPGSWAETAHLPALRALPGFELVGVSASSLESAKTGAAKHRIPLAFETPAEMAQHDAIDLVVISVRVPLHAAVIDQVLASGKVIFSEWPLGIDTAEARALAARATQLGVRTVVGLQARFNPAIAYLRDLIADGYVGDVLSSSVTGSGEYWGAAIVSDDEYLLDENNGATMRTIAVGHAIDAMAYVLGEPEQIRMEQANRRASSQNAVTGTAVPMSAADQVWFTGRSPDDAVLIGHYRGGRWLGTNFAWEILGTKGELGITAPGGNLQMQPLHIAGARSGESELAHLPVPASYTKVPGINPSSQSPALVIAHAYEQLQHDLRDGTTVAPTWADAVRRHENVDLA